VKAYLLTTAIVFVLILVAHVARVIAEGPHLLKEPAFILTSALAFALALWAGSLLLRRSR
jgi:hypothetical protein